MCFSKIVTAKVTTTDRYGRSIAHIILPDGKDLSREIIRNGWGWWYSQYSNDYSLKKLQQSARTQKLGLWQDSNPIPPWEYRHHKKIVS